MICSVPDFLSMKLLMNKRKVMIKASEMDHWDEQEKITLNDLQSFKYCIKTDDYHL